MAGEEKGVGSEGATWGCRNSTDNQPVKLRPAAVAAEHSSGPSLFLTGTAAPNGCT